MLKWPGPVTWHCDWTIYIFWISSFSLNLTTHTVSHRTTDFVDIRALKLELISGCLNNAEINAHSSLICNCLILWHLRSSKSYDCAVKEPPSRVMHNWFFWPKHGSATADMFKTFRFPALDVLFPSRRRRFDCAHHQAIRFFPLKIGSNKPTIISAWRAHRSWWRSCTRHAVCCGSPADLHL